MVDVWLTNQGKCILGSETETSKCHIPSTTKWERNKNKLASDSIRRGKPNINSSTCGQAVSICITLEKKNLHLKKKY